MSACRLGKCPLADTYATSHSSSHTAYPPSVGANLNHSFLFYTHIRTSAYTAELNENVRIIFRLGLKKTRNRQSVLNFSGRKLILGRLRFPDYAI